MFWVDILCLSTLLMTSSIGTITGYKTKSFDCGPLGFICEPNNKVRICEGENILGPSFLCPPNTICNEDSNNVCESAVNYIDPGLTRALRCNRNERIADPSIPNCKGYILCIPNKNRFQGIKFTCSGNTIFNGYTRTCSSPEIYRCPLTNISKTTLELFNDNLRIDNDRGNLRLTDSHKELPKIRPIDCKKYKFTVTQDTSPVRATYFCPPRPIKGERTVMCTIFSNQFCITLERDEEDQFVQNSGAAYRKPRM